MNYLIFLALFSNLLAVAYSFDCSGTLSLESYLQNRGGSFNSAKCISVVSLDITSPAILASSSCDALVLDSTDTTNSGILAAAGITCPALSTSIPTVFNLPGGRGIRSGLGSIYCVESTFPTSRLYRDVLSRAQQENVSNIIFPVIPSDSGNFESRVNSAAFEIRSWIMAAFGNNNMRCPFNIIIPASGTQVYHTVLNVFSKAFTRDQSKYMQSVSADSGAQASVSQHTYPSRPAPSRPAPPRPAPSVPTPQPRTQLLRDFNQYDGIACPTMKNMHTLLSEINDPYINKYTAVTTQISLAFSDLSMGIHSCDMIVLESGADNFLSLMREMGIFYNRATQSSGVTTRSTSFIQNPMEWYSSIKKVVYMSLHEAISEARNLDSLVSLIKEAYMNIFSFATNNKLSEILILPFGIWNSRYSSSVQVITAVIEGLGLALNEYILTNNQIHVTILTETRQQLEVLVDQIKPYFMSVGASDELLGSGSSSIYPIPKPSRPPRPAPPRPYPAIPVVPTIPVVPATRPTYLFDSDDNCMSGTPISEIIETLFQGRISRPSSSDHFSLIYSPSAPGVIGCSCLVVDASDSAQLDMASKLGISRKECNSVGSSELRVFSTWAPNPYIAESWMNKISRVYCLDSSKFIYNSRIRAIEALYKKILASAKFRCNTVLSPLLATSTTTSESRNKEYILQAIKSMDEFYSSSNQRDSLHFTFYEGADTIYFLALELVATYYLEYTSTGGLQATLRTVNQNWLNLNNIAGGYVMPTFREPTARPKKQKGLLGSVRRGISRRISRSSATTPRPSKVPPPRPPLPKIAGNRDAYRPAPSDSALYEGAYYTNIGDFTRVHSKNDLESLYSFHYWVQQVTSFASTTFKELSKSLYLSNSDISQGITGCQAVVIDALHPSVNNILRLIGQSYPLLRNGVTILANRRYGDNSPFTQLNRLYLANTSSKSVVELYEDIVNSAIANQEKNICVPLLLLKEEYDISISRAKSLLLQIINVIFYRLSYYNNSNLKIVFYEGNPATALLAFELILDILSGRSM
ncbi:putative signal peptide protein [Cryptosporidium canis]|uniref:Signal peptide protein n=1 Tax=Cryptosporidium canis TaxID=195482 RepID=A0A9D5HX88_9CRYT|nr:putative signal peptide protein [Cryptosporidium canis]